MTSLYMKCPTHGQDSEWSPDSSEPISCEVPRVAPGGGVVEPKIESHITPFPRIDVHARIYEFLRILVFILTGT